jgi:hypothetical protein
MNQAKRFMRLVLRRLIPPFLGVLTFLVWPSLSFVAGAIPTDGSPGQKEAVDYEYPNQLTGTIYAKGSPGNQVLFKFRRTAVRSGSTIRAMREFTRPDGSPVAVERVVYNGGRLTSYELEQLQTGARGSAVFQRDPAINRPESILFSYNKGPEGHAKTEISRELCRTDCLINDMIPPFIVSHWEELMNGKTVKFRCVIVSRLETVGFKLAKESETTWQGRPVVQIRMAPASFFVARIVKPLIFTVEKAERHRILQYIGRTTPKIKRSAT